MGGHLSDKPLISENVELYSTLLSEHPDLGAAAVGWSAASQSVRFGVVLDFLREYSKGLRQFSLLDVGCGLGHLREFLKGMPAEYRGVDLMANEYREAILLRDPQADTSWLHHTDLDSMEMAEWQSDFTVGVGTFACPWETRDADLPRLMQKMWELSRVGMIVFMLSSLAPPKLKAKIEVAIDDPCMWLRWAAERAPRVILRHDYLPHDFALCMVRTEFGE